MLGRLLFGTSKTPAGPEGYRAYAVGDVHGRADLLEPLLERIADDNRARGAAQTYIIFLGDLIDRGPDSARVLEQLRCYAPEGMTPIFLAGNHEEVMLRALDGDGEMLRQWLWFGGSECVRSYGLEPAVLEGLEPDQAVERLKTIVPQEHGDFVAGFADTFRFGDYLFVHAGIRPGVPLAEQGERDLRWIREPFLSDRRDHGFVVVHGHTIVDKVVERRNRIGLDTGAYRTGVLTAMGVEAEERWFMQQTGPASALQDEAIAQ